MAKGDIDQRNREKPPPATQPTKREPDEEFDEKSPENHKVPGAEGPLGAEAEDDNNP